MSSILTQSYRRQKDHFQPEDMDPQEQRRLRGQLEQIDYTTYLANREIITHTIGKITTADFEKMAARTAQARARWIAEALRLTHSGAAQPSPELYTRLTQSRVAYEELAEAYEGLRRMVERGYLTLS